MRPRTPDNIQELKSNQVFVFGTNAAGFHGAGASGLAFRGDAGFGWHGDAFFLKAMNAPVGSPDRVGRWAVFGVSRGPMTGRAGKSFGIETIRRPGLKRSTPIHEIEAQILEFTRFANTYPHLEFLVTRIGCGLAGYSPEEIKAVFQRVHSVAPLGDHIVLPDVLEFRG